MDFFLSTTTNNDGYIAIGVQRLDSGTDVLRLGIVFECTLHPYTFSSAIASVEVPAMGVAGDPFFMCPQRQKLYLPPRKELGLCVIMKLIPY